jgi:5-methylcytosine-specific restriction endonuclease McrA
MSRCLVLNASYEFLTVLDCPRRALNLLLKGRARAMESYTDRLRGEKLDIPRPAVLVLDRQVDVRSRRLSFDAPIKRNVLIRDGFTCQYCGKRVSMATGTRDHVIPRAKGGQDVITNVVAACVTCNQKKADRTLADSGMKLLNPPRRLNDDEKLQVILKTVRREERQMWIEFLKRNQIVLWVR